MGTVGSPIPFQDSSNIYLSNTYEFQKPFSSEESSLDSSWERELALMAMTFQSFENKSLLARAMDTVFVDGFLIADGYRSSWGQESELLLEEGVSHASCTLLLPGCHVDTYKSYGFLFDGQVAKVEGAYKGDGNTCINEFGEKATNSDFESLADLAKYVETQSDRPKMNEVVATFSHNSLRGLFIRKERNSLFSYLGVPPDQLLNLLYIRKRLSKTLGELPIFIYDEVKGNLEALELDKISPKELASKVTSSRCGYDRKTVDTIIKHLLSE